MRGIRAVLFDAAGTLIELREPAGETYARLAREHGVELPGWRVGDALARVLRGAPPMVFPGEPPEKTALLERDWWRAVVRSAIRAADGSARFGDFDAYFERLFEAFASPARWRAADGAHACLGALRARGLATGVVSNFDHRLPALLSGLGLAPLLDVVVLAADAGAAKPARPIFALALERIGAPAAETAFVGDDAARDLAGARAAGLRAIDARELATLAELPARLAGADPEENP